MIFQEDHVKGENIADAMTDHLEGNYGVEGINIAKDE